LGDTEKAQLNLNYVIDNFAQTEFAKLARVYLEEMGAGQKAN